MLWHGFIQPWVYKSPMIEDQCVLSAVISVRNEEKQLADCLERLSFADEIVVLLDKCTDGSSAIAARFTRSLISAYV